MVERQFSRDGIPKRDEISILIKKQIATMYHQNK